MNKSGIHIKKANRGKFTSWAKSHGMGVQEAASHVMANKSNYSPTIVKRANFAKNAAGWHHEDGGRVGYQTGNTVKKPHITNYQNMSLKDIQTELDRQQGEINKQAFKDDSVAMVKKTAELYKMANERAKKIPAYTEPTVMDYVKGAVDFLDYNANLAIDSAPTAAGLMFAANPNPYTFSLATGANVVKTTKDVLSHALQGDVSGIGQSLLDNAQTYAMTLMGGKGMSKVKGQPRMILNKYRGGSIHTRRGSIRRMKIKDSL